MLDFISMFLQKTFDLFSETRVPGLNIPFTHFFLIMILVEILISVLWFMHRDDR